MNHKEKAIELAHKFYIMNESYGGHITLGMGKQCALICVEELINSLQKNSGFTQCVIDLEDWNKVKTEINKL